MADLDYKSWQVPHSTASEDAKLGWIRESIEEGQNWLKSQRGTADIRRSLDVISGLRLTPEASPAYRSQLASNHLKRNVREVVSALSKLRPMGGFSSDNEAFRPIGEVLNKVQRSLYLRGFFDLSVAEALQWASATNTGYIRPIYRREMGGKGRGEIKLLSYGSPSVLPVQLPSSGDLQQAYSVTLLEEMPVYMAHAMFPLYQDRLQPTKSRYWYSSEIRAAARSNATVLQRIARAWKGKSDSSLSDLYCPIAYTTILDLSINQSDVEAPMGDPGSTWAYRVPFLGQESRTFAGIGADNQPTYSIRKADENDARFYPYRRLIISSDACVLYDGPAFNWHGRLDLIPFALDRWPWEPIGYSPVRDGYDLNSAMIEIERGVMDKLRSQNDQALAYDINSMTKKQAEEFDPMQPRGRMGFDGQQIDEPFKAVVPPEILLVRQEQFAAHTMYKESLDEQLGIKDVLALARARMAGDDMEKLLEANGPIIEFMSRSMEPPMRELGEQLKYLIFQYLPTAQIAQIVGIEGLPGYIADFDPNSLVPSHLPGESTSSGSRYSKPERARTIADNLIYNITPNSLHEYTQMAYKLGLLQMRQRGIPVDSETIAESWSIPNYGKLSGATVLEKWKSEQEMMIELQARLKAIGLSLEESGPLAQLLAAMPQPGAPPGAPAPAQGKSAPEGRPPSGQAAPAMKQKGDGRTVITESHGGGRPV